MFIVTLEDGNPCVTPPGGSEQRFSPHYVNRRASISTRALFHMEGGKGTTSKAERSQLRPDPLAR